MHRQLKIFFCFLVLSGCTAIGFNKDRAHLDSALENHSVELQLLDIHLGMPYEKAKSLLTQKYGKPIRSQSAPSTTATFKLDKKTNNVIEIIAKSDDPSAVGDIAVDGTEPIPGLNFFSNANLGDSEENIRFKFPKAEMEQKKGYRRYSVPFTNYFLDVKNGKVTTLGIWDRFTLSVKGANDSIDLSANLAIIAGEKGWLTQKMLLSKPEDMEKITALAFDPLRPYCKERYPLRQTFKGTVYIDVNVFKNKQELPIPATFLLDTGWLITAISPKLCKKVGCKYVKPSSPEDEPNEVMKRAVSIGGIEFGNTQDKFGIFIITPYELQQSDQSEDGFLGGTTLFAQPLFLNFKQGYLCFPALPVSQVAQKLKYAKLSSEQQARGVWTNFYANNQLLKFGTVDSGAEGTFLSKENITRLKLRNLRKTRDYRTVSGLSRHPLYGPVEIGWPDLGVTQNLRAVAESNDGRSLIGIDFLKHTVLSIEFESGNIYFGQ